MKRIKTRPRSDSRPADPPRRRRRNWDRAAYLALLAVFFAALGNYVAGDRLFLRADGLVLRDRTVIGATALVQVTEVAVRPGQVVEKGDLLLQAESLDILGRLAELSMREAELVERASRLRSQLALARELLPEARERLAELTERQAALRSLSESRLLPAQRLEAQADSVHDATVQVETLASRVEGLATELDALGESRRQATAAVFDLETRYRDGVHHAARGGIVGDGVPAPGEVLTPGDPLLTLYWGEPYVLAYLPRRYLFDVAAGERVTVDSGTRTRTGIIRSILPMSAEVPSEFRNAFRQGESRQLARIALEPGPELPAMAPVRITRPWDLPGIGSLAASLRNVRSLVAASLFQAPFADQAAPDPRQRADDLFAGRS